MPAGNQTGGIDEPRDRDLPDLLLHIVDNLRNAPVPRNRDAVVRHLFVKRDIVRQRIAVGRHQSVVRVALERAVARIADRAVRHLDAEKAVALDCNVQRMARGLQIALRENTLGRSEAIAETDLQSRRILGIRAALRSCRPKGLVQQIMKLRAHLFRAKRIDVRKVVRHHVHVVLLRLHP